MPNTITSPNMQLVLPVVGTDPGPDWATRLYTALSTLVDAHDHSAGKGAQVPAAALNINADLGFGSNNATGLRSVRLASQGSPLALGGDVGCFSNVNGNAYFNNASGTAVQLTSGANVVAVSALQGPVVGTMRTVTTTYQVDSISADYYVLCDTTTAAFSVTLPTATRGRTLVFIDNKGQFSTHNLTVSPAVGKLNGVIGSAVLTTNWQRYQVVSDGVDWLGQ